MKQHIGIAISGGVDSTAAALILQKDYHITGFFMDIGQPDFSAQKDRVVELADRIGFEVVVMDLKKLFNQQVINYFTSRYLNGKTPNPCVFCNRKIKFGAFMDTILDTGIEKIATGHYAKTIHKNNRIHLLKGTDTKKDQSYFLSRLTQSQLSRVIFPLGDMIKDDTYSFVESQGFSCFKGKESQDVCFLEDSNVAAFMEDRIEDPINTGPVVTTTGKTIGTHKGLYRYTIGQRRGLGLPDATPWYVCGLDTENNTLIVGKNDDLFSRNILVGAPHWITGTIPQERGNYDVRIRSTHRGSPAIIKNINEDSFLLCFEEPQRAVAPGQFAVLYDGDMVVGSGEIMKGF